MTHDLWKCVFDIMQVLEPPIFSIIVVHEHHGIVFSQLCYFLLTYKVCKSKFPFETESMVCM
jgi:hypothetical protein